jgi:Asp-tRNA(Asn)/Glu-tRNA(Gln) amidotransferase A subunit family amidase
MIAQVGQSRAMGYWRPMIDPCGWPARRIASAVADGQLSAAEVVQAHLDRIAAVDGRLNAFVDVDAQRALASARAQDDRAAHGQPRGPLGGVPISIKSAIEVAGLRCETGSAPRLGMVAAADAVVVARLRAAGAIVLGTTNVAEMLMGYETLNPLHGRTVNPWDPDRTPGGSSGGESAAIAAGCSAGGIGSDGGGSIRVPAHFTGICGLKPTPGRIPSTGHQPACLGPFSLIGVVGLMARTAADLELFYRVTAGWDHVDPQATPLAAGAGLDEDHDWCVGWFDAHPEVPVTGETAAAVRAAVAGLEAQGVVAEPWSPAVLDPVTDLWHVFFCEVGAQLLTASLGDAARGLPILAAYAEAFPGRPPLTAARLTDAWIARDLARADVLAAMHRHRVLVCPVTALPAFRHDERRWEIGGASVGYLEAMRFTQWFNVLGLPVAVVPAGRSAEGLPIGVQVVGRPFEEARVLAVAARIDAACGGYAAPPEVA